MTQLYMKSSKVICSQETNTPKGCSNSDKWDIGAEMKLNDTVAGDFQVECVLNAAGFLKQIISPINPSLGGRNITLFKHNTGDYLNGTQLKNLFYIHFVFHKNSMLVQSMMSGQSMYTCVRVPSSRFIKYMVENNSPNPQNNTMDIVVSSQALLVCINMYAQNLQNELTMFYESNDRQIVLRGKCANYDKIKTIQMAPLQMPFKGSDFNFKHIDNFSIAPKLLYPCIVDITSDCNSSKLVLELLPQQEGSTAVLGLARGKSTIAVEWDFSFDTNVFDEFHVTKPHLHTYSTKCWQGVANGLKLARRIKIALKDDGIMLIQISMLDTLPDGIHFLYYMYPINDMS